MNMKYAKHFFGLMHHYIMLHIRRYTKSESKLTKIFSILYVASIYICCSSLPLNADSIIIMPAMFAQHCALLLVFFFVFFYKLIVCYLTKNEGIIIRKHLCIFFGWKYLGKLFFTLTIYSYSCTNHKRIYRL